MPIWILTCAHLDPHLPIWPLTGLLQSMADEAGIDLWKLPYEDARPQRLQWLAENAGQPPMAKNPRAMKVGRGCCSTTLGEALRNGVGCVVAAGLWLEMAGLWLPHGRETAHHEGGRLANLGQACFAWQQCMRPVPLPGGALLQHPIINPASAAWLACSLQNAEKLAASKKTPLVARYVHGKIAYVRADSQ